MKPKTRMQRIGEILAKLAHRKSPMKKSGVQVFLDVSGTDYNPNDLILASQIHNAGIEETKTEINEQK